MINFNDFLNPTLILSAILIIAALSSMLADKVGDISFWINGSMIMGALMYCIIGSKVHSMFVAAASAILITGVFTLIHAFATIRLKADFILSATAINIIAPAFAMTLIPALKDKLQPETSGTALNNPFENGLFHNIIGVSEQNVMWFIVAVVIAVIVFVYLRFTKVGKKHSAIGENPNAADAASIHVNRYKYVVLFFSGCLAGLAGIMAVTKIGKFHGNVNGYGFMALAVVILGQWRTSITTIVAITFSVLWVLISFSNEFIDIPTEFLQMIPYILSLASMIFLKKFSRAPQSQGLHFDKSKR